MRVAVYSLCWNEELLLPYFFRHYSFADQITFFDNRSTDRSREIMRANGAIVEHYDSNEQVRDDLYLAIKNTCWQKDRERFDWVIVVDADEFLYHPNMLEFLEESRRSEVTLCIPEGYNMVHDRLPSTSGQIYDEVRRGVPAPRFCKPCLFDPKRVTEIHFHPGCHAASPTGTIRERREPKLKLLHFQHLSARYVVRRFATRRRRVSAINRANRWGQEYWRRNDRDVLRQHALLLRDARVVPL